MAIIYLAGGCFWGIQSYFDRINGVLSSQVGYANSLIENPTYELVCSGKSGAAEAVELHYNEQILSLCEIVSRLFDIINPCALNFQGNDIGTQYRNGVYFLASRQNSDEPIIRSCLASWEKMHGRKAVTQIAKLQNFYPAESYHQKYLQRNPQGYCHIDIESALHSWNTKNLK